MTVVKFLKDNAMQFAGGAQVAVGILLAFTHLTAAQTAAVATLPTGVATFLGGLYLSGAVTAPKPGGTLTVADPASGHTLTVDARTMTVTGSSDRPADTTPQAPPADENGVTIP